MYPILGKSYITQQYGLTSFAISISGKKIYKNFPGGIHPGVDFGTKGLNLPAISTIYGKVVKASLDGGWGNHVEIQGVDGWNRQYAHLEGFTVKVGDQVKPGDIVGHIGTTGASTGVHLHYGNRRRKLTLGWEYRDPSNDFSMVEEAPMPKKKLIKSSNVNKPGVYIFNGKSKFGIPDGETLEFLFGKKGWSMIEEVSDDILTKIPEPAIIPSLK